MNDKELAAVKQALEALEGVVKNCWRDIPSWRLYEIKERITALQSIISQDALDKKAENARELGLSYEPVPVKTYSGGKAWPVQPAPVQERNFCERCGKRLGGEGHIHTCTPPAAQPVVQEPQDGELIRGHFEADYTLYYRYADLTWDHVLEIYKDERTRAAWHGWLCRTRNTTPQAQPAVPEGWRVELADAVFGDVRLIAPNGEAWRFRNTDGVEEFTWRFLVAMLATAPEKGQP
jgi:hypothetical protein